MEPRLTEAEAGRRTVYFVDAAHFVFAAFLGYLWCFVRQFVRAPSGRKRFNVLAALNAVTHELVTVVNDAYINAECVCELLRKIAAASLDVPVTVVLDNARYQRCRLVQELAESLKIELLFLPTYSPNLNLIERLWKFVKKQVLNNHHYADFAGFQTGIQECLAESTGKHKRDLDTLLTLKFQTFENTQSLAA